MFPAFCVSQNCTFDRAMVFQYKEGIGAEIHIKIERNRNHGEKTRKCSPVWHYHAEGDSILQDSDHRCRWKESGLSLIHILYALMGFIVTNATIQTEAPNIFMILPVRCV